MTDTRYQCVPGAPSGDTDDDGDETAEDDEVDEDREADRTVVRATAHPGTEHRIPSTRTKRSPVPLTNEFTIPMATGSVAAASVVTPTAALTLGALALVVGGISLLLWLRTRRRVGDPSRAQTRLHAELSAELDDRLADALGPGTGSHLDTAPTVRRIEPAHGNEPSDDPPLVPVVRVEFGTTDPPGMELVFEFVADVLAAIHPELAHAQRDARVRYYDVEFTFGPDGLLVEGECRRVSVPPELADQLLEDSRYDAFDLRRDVERGDSEDDTPATLWDACRSTSRRS